MNTFFALLKKTLVATVFVMFAVVATYVPQDWGKVQTVETTYAGGGGGNRATETTQWLNRLELGATAVFSSISAAADQAVAFATGSLWTKENILDGIAWSVAKAIVSGMVRSLVNWINSGFQGSPTFVQDLQGFLLNVADEAVGEYIEGLGGIGSFICSPFRLDIQIALALDYELARENQPAPTCTLTGIIDNLEGFLSGTQGSFGEGGWNDWFDVTSQPSVYTTYGATLAAHAGRQAKLINARGEAYSILGFGDGFHSIEICELVHGAGVEKKDCFISKPGKVVVEALNNHLDTGRETLITADEVTEVVSALLGQLANMALTGAAGLLGLSGGTGYTYSGFSAGSYLDQLAVDTQFDPTTGLALMQDALQVQRDYNLLATTYEPQLRAAANADSRRTEAVAAADEAREVIISTTANITRLTGMIVEYTDPNITDERQTELITQYIDLELYTQTDLDAATASWESIVR